MLDFDIDRVDKDPSEVLKLLEAVREIQQDPLVGIDTPREVCWWMLVELIKLYTKYHKSTPTTVHLPRAYEAAIARPVMNRTGVPIREMTTLLGMELFLDAESFRME